MNLALFDFDGTVTTTDTFTPFVKVAIPKTRLRWGTLILLPVILGYKAGFISSSLIRRLIVRVGFKGFSVSKLNELGQQHNHKFLSKTLRIEAMERISWHKKQGDRIVVVSASLDAYLKPWCDELGVELICSELESKNDILTGRYLYGDCTGKNKASRVNNKLNISDYSIVYAYGDTEEDNELLALADEKYFCWNKID